VSLQILSICSNHHWAIHGEPPPDGGPDAEAVSRRAGASGAKVLIVEDDYLIAMQSEEALTSAGFDVSGPAATAEEAVAMAIHDRPALVVMDIRLASKRDGIDAAREIFETLGIRCIFATAHDDSETRQRAAPYAPFGWLSKPYTMASLVTLVSGVLQKKPSN
jgi:DNA-binding NarL/FixJ family response regulator